MHAGLSCVRLNDGPNIKLVELFKLAGTGLRLVCCLVIWGTTGGFLLLRYFIGVVSHPWDLNVSQYVVSVESSYQMFRTTSKAKGEGLDPIKLI